MTSLKVPGNQVMITELMHSPVMTRFFGDQLKGWCGNTAVVRLDGDPCDWPQGVRRWSIALDDLSVIEADEHGRVRETVYRLGVTGRGRRIVQHAVQRRQDRPRPQALITSAFKAL